MPAHTETALRESCSCWGASAAMARPEAHFRGIAAIGASENVQYGNMKKGSKNTWHPRVGSKTSNHGKAHNNNSNNANNSARGNALSDITNVAAGWPMQVDKAKAPKPFQQQPPIAAAKEPLTQAAGDGRTDGSEVADAQSVQEYAPDILKQLFRDEIVALPRTDYMESQTDISPKMRTILIDWLIEVHAKYRLCTETLHLTVNLIDRFLAAMPVTRKKLQLVGVVAMFIASKFEDVRPPELHEMVYITDNAYNKEDLLLMECTMLTTLSFKIVVPTAAHFFEALQNANGCDAMHRELAQYLLELGLLDIRMLQYSPSHKVAAALLLSNQLLHCRPTWSVKMVQQSQLKEASLQACADELRQLLEADREGAGGQLQAVHKKFSIAQHHGVAKMIF